MRISFFVTADAIQFNLQAETDQERALMSAISAYSGPATIKGGSDISMCKGGYIRNFGEVDMATTITIRKEPETR